MLGGGRWVHRGLISWGNTVFEDEKPKASDEKSVKRKIALKKTNRTNIIATNFV